ncbi:MAG: flagellar basal body L-ring protein FlgH [Myxococcales bacterium]|nr:flagellar basal body L-ring protein FlgH [Myxococcales bacterium]
MTRPSLFVVVPGLAVAVLATGCVKHIKPYEPKRRKYELVVPHPAYDAARASGSLFDPNGPGVRLTTDARAQSINDIVVVAIDERATAQRDTATETSRDDEQIAALTSFLGVIAELEENNPNFNGATAMNLASQHTFKGEGSTSRNDRVQATVPAMVRRVLPNGNLFIEGDRVVMVNSEEHHFYISGVIRPEDIDGNGVVNSSRMADAQIEFTGRGALTAGSEKGWFSSLLDYVWPF